MPKRKKPIRIAGREAIIPEAPQCIENLAGQCKSPATLQGVSRGKGLLAFSCGEHREFLRWWVGKGSRITKFQSKSTQKGKK
jgi:hypothetical protein